MKEDEELKKLNPEARLKKLKEIIDKKNKELLEKSKELNSEIEAAKKLTEKAKIESEEIEELKKKIKFPELKEVDITKLFEKEEDALEERVKEAARKDDIEQEQKQLYQLSPSMPTQQIYADVMSIYRAATNNGMVTPAMAEDAASIQYAVAKKQEAINAGNYSATAEVIRQAEAVKTMADKILSIYTGGVKKKEGI
jgi:hypothetical protein